MHINDVKFTHKLIRRKEDIQEQLENVQLESLKPSRQSDIVIPIGSVGFFSNCPVNIFTLVSYLKSEIEKINIQLKELGIELEG